MLIKRKGLGESINKLIFCINVLKNNINTNKGVLDVEILQVLMLSLIEIFWILK